MAKEITLIHVFVSSPADLSSDRRVISKAVEELNRTALADRNVRLEAYTWELNASPDFGTDPQAVLNRQLSQFDIYVGMLGHRFGTPTPRALSGTEEEFNAAYNRWKSDSRSCRLMFYFNNSPTMPASIDPDQLRKVQEFRGKLGGLGGLYFTYSDAASELPELARRHLLGAVRDYGKTWGPQSSGDRPHEVEIPPEEDGESLLDLSADIEEAMAAYTQAFIRIGTAHEQMSQEINQRTQDLQRMQESGSVRPSKLRDTARSTANAIATLGLRIDAEMPLITQTWSTIREKLLLLLSIGETGTEGEKNALRGLSSELRTVVESQRKALRASNEMTTVMQSLAFINKDMRKAVRQAHVSSSIVSGQLERGSADLEEILFAIDRRIGSAEPDG